MASILLKEYRGATIAVFSINGTTASQVGGEFRRESSSGDGLGDDFRHENNQAVQIYGRLFAWHTSAVSTSRIYRFDGDASSADISGLTGLFVRGETIIGQTSSASATIVDSSVSGDDFLIVGSINGTFTVGETVVGQTSSATAVLATGFAQGGASGFEGEWYVDHTISIDLEGTLANTGLYAIQNDGTSGALSGLFVTVDNFFRAINYDAENDEWAETDDLLATTNSRDEWGRGSVIGTSIILPYETGNSSVTTTVFYNASVNTVGNISLTTTGGAGNGDSFGNPIIQWLGRIFMLSAVTGTQDLDLMELAGGSWQRVILFNGAAAGGSTEFKPLHEGGTLFLIIRNSLYMFFLADLNGGGGGNGWGVFKLTNKEGTITCDNVTSDGTQLNATDTQKMAQFMLPSSLALGTASLTLDDVRWRAFLDQETNDPDGVVIQQLYHVGNPSGGTTDILTWNGVEDISDQPGVTYTWDGTTTVAFTSGGTVVQVADWIGLKSDDQLFRVTAVGASTITIENPAGITIPTGSGTSEILLATSSVGTNLSVAEMAFSENTARGGGERIFTKGELDIAITGVTPNSSGQLISFVCFSDSGSTTVNVEFFFGPNFLQTSDTQCTLSAPSAGTLVGNQIQGLTADNTTEYSVTWLTSTDSVSDGDNRLLVPKASV